MNMFVLIAGVAHALFGLDPESPIHPDEIPVFADAAGTHAVVAGSKERCDPEDTTGEGICDYEGTIEIRRLDGKVVETVPFVIGNWKRKTEVEALSRKLSELKLERGQRLPTPNDPSLRGYRFAAGTLVIDRAGKKMRLRILAPDGAVLHERALPARCRGRVWGANAWWIERGRRLFVNPLACPKGSLQIVELSRK